MPSPSNFFSEAVGTRHKKLDDMFDKMAGDQEMGLMFSFSQMFDVVYSDPNGDFKIPTTHVKKRDIQVQHADEATQRDKADIGYPTSASINHLNIDLHYHLNIDRHGLILPIDIT